MISNLAAKEIKYGVLIAIGFILLASIPLLPDNANLLSIIVPITMYTVLSTSWAIFSGPTRYISLATAAFYGVGTYTLAMGLELLPYPVLILLAALFGALLAGLVGLATLRLSGVYFVIFTLGLAEFIRQIVIWVQNNYGGHRGSYVFTDLTDSHIYWQLLGLALLTYIVAWLVSRSRLGFAVRIIGGDELVAKHSGIHVAGSKIMLFMISGAFASMVGAVLAPRLIYIEPAIAFNPQLSFMVVIIALLGGIHKIWGPLVGAIPFALTWEFIASNFPSQTTLLMGLAFLAVVYFIPNGISGVLIKWKEKMKQTSDINSGQHE